MRKFWRWWLILSMLLVACDELTDSPATPTIMLLPTAEETLVVELPSPTPSPSQTVTETPSPTITASPSVTETSTATTTASATATLITDTPTVTVSPTLTASATATDTPIPSATDSPSPTVSPSPTDSATPSETPTDVPSATATLTPSATDTPTETASPTDTPSATPSPTATATDTPTITPTHTAVQFVTRAPSATVTPSPTASASPTATATNTPTPFPTLTPSLIGVGDAPIIGDTTSGVGIGDGEPPTEVADAPTLTPLPFSSPTPLPTIAPLFVPTSTPLFNNAEVAAGSAAQNDVIVVDNDAAIVNPDPTRPITIIRNQAYSPNGASAVVGGDAQLYLNGVMMTISPSSRFGMNTDFMRIVDLAWTSDGRFLAMSVDGNQRATDQTGVWVIDTANNTSWQILRNGDHHARRVSWSPNGTVVLILTDVGITFLPREHQANDGFRMHPFSDATWALDSASAIATGGNTITRIRLDFEQTYETYELLPFGLGVARAAIELSNGRILFLGAPTLDGDFALYSYSPAGTPQRLSQGIGGRVLSWEWNDSRTALLVLMESGSGRRLLIFRSNGAVEDITPPEGAPLAAYWN